MIPLAAVIPYFQREAGILRRAVASALRQSGVDPFPIIVVDDSSPVPAADELGELIRAHGDRIRIIRRENGGPAAARNAGLDAIEGAARYVAFLDSDDEWVEGHVANAVRVLERGADVYFTDFYHIDQDVSAFQRAARIDPADHRQLFAAEPLYEYQGDMVVQILTGNVIGTSTLVYLFEKFADVRFREEFRYAGEDYLFWLDLAARDAKFAFSTVPECRCGRGVNVYSGSGWGTDRYAIRLHHEMKYRKTAARLFALSAEARKSNARMIGRLRAAFVADLLHRARSREPIDLAVVLSQLRLDPLTVLGILPVSYGLVKRAVVGPKGSC